MTVSAKYYPFGSVTPGRQFSSASYRYGFNGKEKDNETYGSNNAYDFGARIYDPRLGRWLSLDRYFGKHPSLSPYNYANNNAILYLDEEGNIFKLYSVNSKAEKTFVTYMQKQFSNKIEVQVKDNILTLHKPGDTNPIDINSDEGKALYNSLTAGQKELFTQVNTVVQDKRTVNYLSAPNKGTLMGSYNIKNDQTGEVAQIIDVKDMEKVSQLTEGKVSEASQLAHEIAEGFIGQTKSPEYTDAHNNYGLKVQAKIDNYDKVTQIQFSDRVIIHLTKTEEVKEGDKTYLQTTRTTIILNVKDGQVLSKNKEFSTVESKVEKK